MKEKRTFSSVLCKFYIAYNMCLANDVDSSPFTFLDLSFERKPNRGFCCIIVVASWLILAV